MPLITLRSNVTFTADESSTILNAASAAGVSLPYSCKTGRCSTCKCKVLHGSTTALHPELGLSPKELQGGWVLSCVRTAGTDLVLDVEDLGGVVLNKPRTFPCRIKTIETPAKDTLKVQLMLPPSAEFSFLPGQYIDVIGPNGLRRSYSLANADFSNRLLELHIRRVDGGAMSDYWFNSAQINDILRLNGPLGTFFLRKLAGLDLIFLATGTGIAPVKSMLHSLAGYARDQLPRSVHVIWGARKREDLYLDELNLSAGQEFIPVLSRPDGGWTHASGYVQNVLLERMPNLTDAVVYACGSDAMIREANTVLTQAGLPENRFYSDAFVCSSSQ